MTVVVLLGAPGAGKGTQAAVLRERLGLPHISTGDLFRAAVREGTPLGLEAKRYMDAGQLVPDGVTTAMLADRLTRPDAAPGVILDGFPRTRPQAVALDEVLARSGDRVAIAPLIDVPEGDLVARLADRWVCQSGAHIYHAHGNPPRVAGICDVDGTTLRQRDDDRPEVIAARLASQLEDLAAVVAHYRDAGVLVTVDGLRPIAEVTASLVAAVEAATAAAR